MADGVPLSVMDPSGGVGPGVDNGQGVLAPLVSQPVTVFPEEKIVPMTFTQGKLCVFWDEIG
jgi:hypothetical protein